MLDRETVKEINDFVFERPRNVQEISELLGVHWRTADRYVRKIADEEGTIDVHTFREGTRGALKIVFWNNIERLHRSDAQEALFRKIEAGRNKGDFSPFGIYQYVDSDKKEMRFLTEEEYGSDENFNNFRNLLQSADSRILFFSGNMTFSTYEAHDRQIREVMEELARDKVVSKVLTRVELPGIRNVMDVMSINKRVGWDAVDIRHEFQPLRATIIDDDLVVMKERLDPADYDPGELDETLYCLYYIRDREWITWLQKIFWRFFRNSVDAETRIKDLRDAGML